MLRVEFASGAEADLQEIFNRLEDYEEGFGARFIATIDSSVTRLSQFPRSAPIYVKNIRRLILQRPPHGIFYEVQRTRLIVIAILNLHQDRKTIFKRLNS